MIRALPFVILLVGCNAAPRAQVIDDAGDEVVSLPGGGALILRAIQQRKQCFVRARFFRGWVPVDCDLAQQIRP